MIKNSIIVSVRSVFRHRVHFFVNFLGLGIGIASFLIIVLYLQRELSFNTHISNVEDKYRVVEIQNEPGVGEQHVAVTMGPLAEALHNDFPEVIRTLRMNSNRRMVTFYKDKSIDLNYSAFADSTVFDMLSVELLHGNKEEALKKFNSIVLSEKSAGLYFRDPADAVGEIIEINNMGFIVTGIFKDLPQTSTVYFESLLPFKILEDMFAGSNSWGSNSFDTYVQIAQGASVAALEEKMPAFLDDHLGENQWPNLEMYFQAMLDIHLHSGHVKFQVFNYHQGDFSQVLIFGVVAVLILLVACINYINLTTAMGMKRSREVGIRKVIGAGRGSLMSQFLGESLITTVSATILAIGIMALALPELSKMLALELDFSLSNSVFVTSIIVVVFFVSFLSGFYPAFYLSSFKPAVIFRGPDSGSTRGNRGFLRKALVIVQFVVSIVILIATFVIVSQVNYFKSKDRGYNDKALLAVPFTAVEDEQRLKEMELFKAKLEQESMVQGVAISSSHTGAAGNQGGIFVADAERTKLMVRYGYIDEDFFPLYEIPIIEGRNFNTEIASDLDAGIILNESAVKHLGWEKPIGKQFYGSSSDTALRLTVIGVVKDYNYYSFLTPIEPAVFLYYPMDFQTVIARLNQNNLAKGREKVEEIWESLFPREPFHGYYVEDRFKYEYANELNTMKMFIVFAMLCIFISCLGLLGLISFVINQKNKEIAVRKVFGSSANQLVLLISKEFGRLILLASLIGIPVAWFYMDKWLNNFVYRINLSWYYFFLAILVALLVAFITISYKAFRAAKANPADTLHYE